MSSVERRILAAQPGDTITFVVGDQFHQARVDRVTLAGRTVRLSRRGSKIRGRLASQDIELNLGASQVTGRIGGRPILLDVARADQSLTISGQFGARAVALHLNVRALGGDIGPCRYALEFRRNEYLGQVGCGGEPAPVQLRVPAALVARGDVELAAMLTTFMAR